MNGLSEADRARFSVAFPCAACLHREECYPVEGAQGKPIVAESRLVPVSYYEFHLLPLEVMELHYDEMSDLLGGASWKVLRELVRQTGAPGRGIFLSISSCWK